MVTAYFDVGCGASGDMILAALLDAGAPLARLRGDLAKLGISGLKVATEGVRRNSLACTHMSLTWGKQQEYRHLEELQAIIARGGYSDRVNRQCAAVLTRLAESEAAAHGIEVGQVHFHEIGAVDTIVDVAGAALCLEYLDVNRVLHSTLTVGHGSVNTAHGTMPVPVPATSLMIEGLRVQGLDIPTEILTPTGCAILTALGEQATSFPAGTVTGNGRGCGDRQFESKPNMLRAFLVRSDVGSGGAVETVCVIESDMDHISGEVMAFAAQECLAGGARDASWGPVFMKKGRPGYRLTVVCEPSARQALTDVIMAQTRTLGVRYHMVERTVAHRETNSVTFLDTSVEEKVCTYQGQTFRKLEYEALASLARSTGKPLPEILEMYIRERDSSAT